MNTILYDLVTFLQYAARSSKLKVYITSYRGGVWSRPIIAMFSQRNRRENDSFCNTSEIDSIEFYVIGDRDILANSCVQVTNKNTYDASTGQAVAQGLIDSHMGPTESKYLCSTCNNTKIDCPGHPGHAALRYPVKNPLFKFSGNIDRWLRVICFYCGMPVLAEFPPVPIYSSSDKQLTTYLSRAKAAITCSSCRNIHYNIVRSRDKSNALQTFIMPKTVRTTGRSKDNSILLTNVEIRDIFRRIPDYVVKRMQHDSRATGAVSHPSNFIIQNICIPPNAIRLDVLRGTDRVHSSALTKAIRSIIILNDALPPVIPPRASMDPASFTEYMKQVAALDVAVYNLIKGSPSAGEQSGIVSITESLQGKRGDLRQALLGKRSKLTIRAVISADPSIAIGDVGMPLSIARQIFIPVTVQYWNIERIMPFFINGTKYPGCSLIEKGSSGMMYGINNIPPDYQLQTGDIVHINITDGDYIGFGRQPSLSYTSLSGHRVKIIYSEDHHVLTVPPSACNLYNADYDGDMMLGVVVEFVRSKVELKCMSSVPNWLRSYKNGKPILGSFHDSEIGAYTLTKQKTTFNRWHAMQLVSGTNVENARISFPPNKTNYTGHEIVSMVLPKNINMTRKPTIFNAATYVDLPVESKKVEIIRGELRQGILDHATIGQDTGGSLYHVICNSNGNLAALRAIFDIQCIALQTNLYKGFTVGIEDVVISDETFKRVKECVHKLLIDANLITQRLHDGDLSIPANTTAHDYYEQEIMNALNPGTEVDTAILGQIKLFANGIAQLVLANIKGSQNNLININGVIGQVTVGGKRPPKNFGYMRTGPYFKRYDPDPVANGFVCDSYANGVHPISFTHVAQAARRDNINIALATAVSGEQNRLAVKTLETMIVNYSYMAVKGTGIVQVRYGESGIDPRNLETVVLPTIMLGDAAMEALYHTKVSALAKTYQNAGMQKLLDEEYAQLVDDRNQLRHIGRGLEDANVGNYLIKETIEAPINIYNIVFDHINNNDLKMDEPLSPANAIATVKKLIADLPYVYFNEEQARQQSPIPEHLRECMFNINTLIRVHLSTAMLIKHNISNALLDRIVATIWRTYAKALIDYGTSCGIIAGQCISDPLVQDSLSSKKRKANTSTVDRYKEITGAYPTHRMKNPTMLICVKPEFENNESAVRKIANSIQVLRFGQFVTMSEILYEAYGNVEYEEYKHEQAMITDFEKRNPGMMIPPDLVHWCIRYEVDNEELIMKGLNLSTLLIALRDQFPHLHIINSPGTAPKIILRCYLRSGAVRFGTNLCTDIEHRIIAIIDEMHAAILRGIDGIMHAHVISRAVSKIVTQEDVQRAIDNKEDMIPAVGELIKKKIFCIHTDGTNLAEVLEHDMVDGGRCCSDSIVEMCEMFGIHCARQRIIKEICNLMSNASPIHCSIYGDELTRSGVMTNIERSGLREREKNNVLLRTGFRYPAQTLVEAAITNQIDKIGGASAPLIIGKPPRVGSLYTDIAINTKFIRENISSIEEQLDNL